MSVLSHRTQQSESNTQSEVKRANCSPLQIHKHFILLYQKFITKAISKVLIYDFGEDDKAESCGKRNAHSAVEDHMYHSHRCKQYKHRSEKLADLAIGKQGEYPATVKIAKWQ
mgnify:FL=1|jgi:hypothetical protein